MPPPKKHASTQCVRSHACDTSASPPIFRLPEEVFLMCIEYAWGPLNAPDGLEDAEYDPTQQPSGSAQSRRGLAYGRCATICRRILALVRPRFFGTVELHRDINALHFHGLCSFLPQIAPLVQIIYLPKAGDETGRGLNAEILRMLPHLRSVVRAPAPLQPTVRPSSYPQLTFLAAPNYPFLSQASPGTLILTQQIGRNHILHMFAHLPTLKVLHFVTSGRHWGAVATSSLSFPHLRELAVTMKCPGSSSTPLQPLRLAEIALALPALSNFIVKVVWQTHYSRSHGEILPEDCDGLPEMTAAMLTSFASGIDTASIAVVPAVQNAILLHRACGMTASTDWRSPKTLKVLVHDLELTEASLSTVSYEPLEHLDIGVSVGRPLQRALDAIRRGRATHLRSLKTLRIEVIKSTVIAGDLPICAMRTAAQHDFSDLQSLILVPDNWELE